MKLTIKCFASIREVVGANEVLIDLENGSTTSDVLQTLVKEFPALKSIIDSTAVAVNMNYITEPVEVKETDVVAILPPISGG